MDEHNSPNRIWPWLWKPALAGIACGALFTVTSPLSGNISFIHNIWQILLNEYRNTDLSAFMSLQYVAILVLSILLSAFLAITFTYKNIKKASDALIPGAVAGAVFVPATFFFYMVLYVITYYPVFGPKEPPPGLMYPMESPLELFIIFCYGTAIFTAEYAPIAMAITATVAAVYASLLRRLQGGDKKIKSANRLTIAITLSMVALMMVAPPAIAYVGLSIGWVKGTSHEYYDCVSMERLNENTIAINYTGGPNLRFDRDMPFTIEVYGADGQSKNATNTEAIVQSGLLATISPGYGLRSKNGASIALSGDGVKKPANVVVTAHLANSDSVVSWNLII